MKYILLFIVTTMIGFGGFLAHYLGAFANVDITETTLPAQKVIYVENLGPYHKVSKLIGAMEDFMKAQGLPCGRTFGEYYDDPQVVEEARLKSRVGCLIDSSMKTEPTNLQPEMKIGEIAPGHFVQAVFTGSPGIGPIKVYPKISDYITSHKLKQSGAIIEIYEIHSITEKNAMTTTYLFRAE